MKGERKRINFEFDNKKFEAEIKSKGYSITDLDAKTGISFGGLEHIAYGDRNPSEAIYRLLCLTLDVPYDTFMKKEEPKKQELPEPIPDKQIDRIEVQLDRMERKIDRLEMLCRSIQNENLALRQELIKRGKN